MIQYQVLIKNSLKALNHHKGRTFLTALGIIIGIASIISLLAIGHGAEEKVKAEIMRWGSNFIFLHSGRMGFDDTKTNVNKLKPIKNLTYFDVHALKHSLEHIKAISPICYAKQQIKFHTNIINTEIKGGNEQLFTILNRTIHYGTLFLKNMYAKHLV